MTDRSVRPRGGRMRMPRSRSCETESCTPAALQSSRPLVPSPETNSRFRNTDTSLCEAGQKYAAFSVGWDGDVEASAVSWELSAAGSAPIFA